MISIIVCTNRDHSLQTILDNFLSQTITDKELIIILNNENIVHDDWKNKLHSYENIQLFQKPSSVSLGECLNFGVKKANFDLVAKMDDDDYYSPYYLEHTVHVLRERNVDVIGKTAIYMYFSQDQALTVFNPYKYAGNMEDVEETYNPKVLMGGTLLFKKEVAQNVPFPDKNVGEDSVFCEDCIQNGYKVYSMGKENYVYIRTDHSHHSWKMKNNKLRMFCSFITHTTDFKKFIEWNPNE